MRKDIYYNKSKCYDSTMGKALNNIDKEAAQKEKEERNKQEWLRIAKAYFSGQSK